MPLNQLPYSRTVVVAKIQWSPFCIFFVLQCDISVKTHSPVKLRCCRRHTKIDHTIEQQSQIVAMSVVGNNRVGIPIVVLHDAEGAVIEVETKNGELIRGLLFEAEDQMNLYIKNAVIHDTNGVKRKINQVYLRGTEIVFIVLPDMLKRAPMFNRYVATELEDIFLCQNVVRNVGLFVSLVFERLQREFFCVCSFMPWLSRLSGHCFAR